MELSLSDTRRWCKKQHWNKENIPIIRLLCTIGGASNKFVQWGVYSVVKNCFDIYRWKMTLDPMLAHSETNDLTSSTSIGVKNDGCRQPR